MSYINYISRNLRFLPLRHLRPLRGWPTPAKLLSNRRNQRFFDVKKPLSDMTLLKILRDMDLGVTVHGFRSAFRDWVAAQTDHAGEIAEAALARTVSNKIEAAYRRTDFLDKRRLLMRDWSAYRRNVVAYRAGNGL